MHYEFDICGWYVGQYAEPGPRTTTLVPANLSTSPTVGQLRSNYTGYSWIELPYDGPYVPPVQTNADGKITKLAFRNRFTPTEKAKIEFAALDNPSATYQERMVAAGIRASMADQRDASFIDLLRADTRAGVEALEAATILAAGRAAIILDTIVNEETERYTA